MKYCSQCGNPMNDLVRFCSHCGSPVGAPMPAPAQPSPAEEELAFIEQTRRLLRWERKAWSIFGKAQLGLGIGFFILFMILAMAMGALDAPSFLVGLYFGYGVGYGLTFIILGIIALVNANKIPYYLEMLTVDFAVVHKRCTSGGMGAVNILFCGISAIFFFINLSRLNNCKEMVDRIITKQRERSL